MIVSHARRFIFLKPMKVAGTSLEILLSKYCGSQDIITPFGQKDEELRRRAGGLSTSNHFTPLQKYSVGDWGRLTLRGQRARMFMAHMPATEIRPILGAKIWDSYTKVSVVRNPFDYAVSRYWWEKRLHDLPDFRSWLFENPEILLENRRITHIDGECQADFMIRYEHFEEDLPRLAEVLELPGDLYRDLGGISAKVNVRPNRATAAESFTDCPECARLVEMLCAEDIETYSYSLS